MKASQIETAKVSWAAGGSADASPHYPSSATRVVPSMEAVRVVIDRWKLAANDAAGILWLSAADVRKLIAGRAIAPQPESVTRSQLIDELDALLALQIGPELIPYWLRTHNPHLGASPIRHLAGKTGLLRQLQRRLRLELADRFAFDKARA